MPQQETFFEYTTGDRRIEVLKTYDERFAREAFGNMDEAAQAHLWSSLKPEQIYDPAGLPTPQDSQDYEAFLWDELIEQAREDWNLLSFFVVNEAKGGRSESLYVSADWPSAELFAKEKLAAFR